VEASDAVSGGRAVTSPSVEFASQREVRKRVPRMWPVLLTLYFLSPLIGEVLSGSTPPLLFVQPFGFIFLPLLYGSSALLIREIVVRRHLGWANILILGASFGVFQEALIVQTWFNFMAKSSPSHSSGTYSVAFGTNWAWALNLTVYHAVISISVPLILLQLFFPRRAKLPGLGVKSALLLLGWLLIPCALLAVTIATKSFATQGYTGPPPVGYAIAVIALLLSLAAGSLIRFPEPRQNIQRAAPRPLLVGLGVFALTTLFFALAFILPALGIPAPITVIISAGLVVLALRRISTWSAREGWGRRQALAVAMGVLAYFLFVWGPLIEFILKMPYRQGVTLANAVVFLALTFLSWRLRRRSSPTFLAAQ
jgi:hypothetical protein